MKPTRKNWARAAAIAVHLFLAIGLLALAGCATGGKTTVPPVVDNMPVLVAHGPSVARLKDGREGFVITEPSKLDAESRSNFAQAVALIKEGSYQKSVELLEKVIAQSPGLTAPRVNIAIAYNRLNKPEQAEQHLKTALELVAGHPVASNEYGLLLRKGGRFAEARTVYEKGLAAFPEYHPLEKNLAILCDLYLKDFACARDHYLNYGKAMPADKQVTLWLADLQTRSGHLAPQMGNGR